MPDAAGHGPDCRPSAPSATGPAGQTRRRSTGSSPRTSRPGSNPVTAPKSPSRRTSKRSSGPFLRCGILCFGFARARCTACGHGFLIGFSCKGRGVCPSCNGRRMAQTAAHLVDRVIPPVPVRQWVISVPKRLRCFLADRPEAVTALTAIFLDEIERLLRDAAAVSCDGSPPSAQPRLGAVSFLHRFGSALNRHVHLHGCVTDGVFMATDPADGVAFLPARPISPADLAALAERVRRRLVRWFRHRQIIDADGRPERIRYALPRHKRGTWIGPGRRRKATAPRAQGVVELTPFEFLDRLASLVPPPRKHRHRYHGVFAPNHKLRRAVTALAIGNIGKRCEAATDGHAAGGQPTEGCCDTQAKPRSHDTSRIAWAKLLARLGEEFPLECPACGGDIRLIAFITEPPPIRKILTHLGEPLVPPPILPARGPPTEWDELVQAHDDREAVQASSGLVQRRPGKRPKSVSFECTSDWFSTAKAAMWASVTIADVSAPASANPPRMSR
jgi:hypothetical protein